MKKLTGLLAAVLVFAFTATSAFAAGYTDAAGQANTTVDAAAKLTALGITEGYEDGSYDFDGNITRAEFAKVAVIASGAESTATMLEGSKPSYTDVKSDAWYTGWINAAESLGLVQGDGNGLFRPNDTISNQEVITVLMRALGYNDNLPGAWPTNYVTKANKVDMLDDVTIVASAAAKRGDVAVMVSNALDAFLVTYDKDTDEFVKKQTTKGGVLDDDITLLDDAFDGAFTEVDSFDAVSQVRDAAKQQLNWEGFIVDKDTRVSVNGGNLFDLEGHQGKIYFVEDNDKLYARFIEVESYTKTVSDKPTQDGKKIDVNGTKYNAASTVDFSQNATNGKKNSKYILYFNDDDQVYAVCSDLDKEDKAYVVKSINSSTVKLTGSAGANETMDNDDDDVLIWDGTNFIAPSALKVGDAVIKVADNDDLYELTELKSGVLKSKNSAGKYNIDGTNYVRPTAAVELDGEYETFDGDIADAFGNTIQYLLNDDNSISAIIVDEVTSGTKLYGIVTGGDSDSSTSWTGSDLNNITIFTQEGTSVKYELDDDEFDSDDITAAEYYGRLVEYKLNKDGEIKNLAVVKDSMGTGEIKVKNNSYLSANGNNLTLASNVAIFEITEDDDEIDVTLVTRAALLGGDDFTPGDVTGLKSSIGLTDNKLAAYCTYVTNSNGAVKAMAYTDADSTTYYAGIIDEWAMDGDNDVTIYFVGDETEYEFVSGDENEADDDDLIIYTKKGGDVKVAETYADKADLASYELTGWSGGLMTLCATYKPEVEDQTDDGITDTIMTDSNTVVFVQDKNGKYSEGTLDDITKGAYVVVPVVDDDGYADFIIVDEYKAKDDNKVSATK